MALIGPRPLLVQYLPLYSKEQSCRHEVRPGITGWGTSEWTAMLLVGQRSLNWDVCYVGIVRSLGFEDSIFDDKESLCS